MNWWERFIAWLKKIFGIRIDRPGPVTNVTVEIRQ